MLLASQSPHLLKGSCQNAGFKLSFFFLTYCCNKKGPTTISIKNKVGVFVADRKGDQDGMIMIIIIVIVLYDCRVNAVC